MNELNNFLVKKNKKDNLIPIINLVCFLFFPHLLLLLSCMSYICSAASIYLFWYPRMYLCGLIFPMQCPNFKLVQENWLPTLRNLVARINETSSRNFQEMAVAGELSLGMVIALLVENVLYEQFGWKGSRVEFAGNWQLPANSPLLPPPSPSIHYSILSQLFYIMFLLLRWAWQGLWSIWNTYKSQVQVTAAWICLIFLGKHISYATGHFASLSTSQGVAH